QLPKFFPRRVRLARGLDVLGRHIQRAALPFALIGEVEMRTMTLGRISLADAPRVATATGGFRKPALDHDLGGFEESAPKLRQSLVLTHVYMLGTLPGMSREKRCLGLKSLGSLRQSGHCG